MPELTIEAVERKISGYWAACKTTSGNNHARNAALADLFFDLYQRIQESRKNLTIDGAQTSLPVAVGILVQPRSVSGVKFFHIPANVMIDGVSVDPVRMHTLSHYLDGHRHALRIDTGVQIYVDRSEVYEITDSHSKKLWLKVDYDQLPAVNVDEKIEFIPIYDEDFLAEQGRLWSIPRWRLEDDDHYRARIKTWLARGACSFEALKAYADEYATFYGWTAKTVEYWEHYGAWPVVGRSFMTEIKGYHTFKKDRSDNIGYLTVELSGVSGELRETAIAELSTILDRFRPQGLRFKVSVN